MTGRKVRTKKLNIKTLLPVFQEHEIDPSEYDALATESQIATGVEQAEENEYHLQSILKDAGTSNDQEIPVPPPQESNVDYNALYSLPFSKSTNYIRSSNTVEESITCPYDMTAEDYDHLQAYNEHRPASDALSDDDFERIMDVYESLTMEQTPFASVDNTVIAYETMVPALNQLGSANIMTHAKHIYYYWSSRRQELGNKPLHPTLKFETHQETDDTDPYVCFRRREARQTRKTRARDVQVADRLKRLRRECEDGRLLVTLSYEREMLKRDLLQQDKLIYENRAIFKEMKIRLNSREGDEELYNHKKKKLSEVPAEARANNSMLGRLTVPTNSRYVDSDYVMLSDKLEEKENDVRKDAEARLLSHRKWNENHIDFTAGVLSPAKGQASEAAFRPARVKYLMTPPASALGDPMDIDDDQDDMTVAGEERKTVPVFQVAASSEEDEEMSYSSAYRRRVGRLGRLWIDRRQVLSPAATAPRDGYSDRWRYDNDDNDNEPSVFQFDVYDTPSLKFRADIPIVGHNGPRRQQPQGEATGFGVGPLGALPNGTRASQAGPQQQSKS